MAKKLLLVMRRNQLSFSAQRAQCRCTAHLLLLFLFVSEVVLFVYMCVRVGDRT